MGFDWLGVRQGSGVRVARLCSRGWPRVGREAAHAAAGGVVAARLGLVLAVPAHADDENGGVGETGEVAGQLAGADAAAVLVEGEVADVMDAVLDLPMSSVEGEDLRKRRRTAGRARSAAAANNTRFLILPGAQAFDLATALAHSHDAPIRRIPVRLGLPCRPMIWCQIRDSHGT